MYFLLNLRRMVLMLAVACVVLSCDDSDSADAGSAEAYVISLRTQGEASADYVMQVDDLMNGEISPVGKGIEQMGWCYYTRVGNTFLSITYANDEDFATGYSLDVTGKLREKGKFAFEALDCTGAVDDENLVGIGAPWGGGSYDCELMVINAKDMAITSRKLHPLYTMHPGDTLNKWPSGTAVDGNNIFVAFYPLDGESWLTEVTDTAYVSIFKYPTLEYVKTIKDTRTGPIGMYGSIPAVFENESGDIYMLSSCSHAGGYTQTTKPSGILRIRSGQTEFDKGYFFNFEAAANAKIIMGGYAGNNKALIRYMPSNRDSALWQAINIERPVNKLAIVDLETQTVTPVTGVPDHSNGWASPFFIEDGKAYVPIISTVANEVRIYEIDIATATAKAGALVQAAEVPLIYKVRN